MNPVIQQIPITSREQWLAMRKQDITASIAGALIGLHPHETALTVYADKTGFFDKDPEDGETPERTENAAMRRGRLLEPVVVEMLREDFPGYKIERGGSYYRDPLARIGATPDVLAVDEKGRPGIFQIKTVAPAAFRKSWKQEDGSFEVPAWIAIQAIVEATLTGAEWAKIAVLQVDNVLTMQTVDVPIHAGVFERIRREAFEFWANVEKGQPPKPDYSRDAKIAAMLQPLDDNPLDLTSDNMLPGMLDERERLKAEADALEVRLKEIDGEIRNKIGAHSSAVLPGWKIASKLTERKGYTVQPTSYRPLRVTRLKGNPS
jgi:predicted phage-related endonuclease